MWELCICKEHVFFFFLFMDRFSCLYRHIASQWYSRSYQMKKQWCIHSGTSWSEMMMKKNVLEEMFSIALCQCPNGAWGSQRHSNCTVLQLNFFRLSLSLSLALFQACFGRSSVLLLQTTPGISGSRARAPPCGERGETAEDRERGEEQAQVRQLSIFCFWKQLEMRE